MCPRSGKDCRRLSPPRPGSRHQSRPRGRIAAALRKRSARDDFSNLGRCAVSRTSPSICHEVRFHAPVRPCQAPAVSLYARDQTSHFIPADKPRSNGRRPGKTTGLVSAVCTRIIHSTRWLGVSKPTGTREDRDQNICNYKHAQHTRGVSVSAHFLFHVLLPPKRGTCGCELNPEQQDPQARHRIATSANGNDVPTIVLVSHGCEYCGIGKHVKCTSVSTPATPSTDI